MSQARVYEGGPKPAVAGYDVEELIGVGGTGEVWRARDVLSGRLVALKRLRHDGPPAERDRLRREAAVLAGLSSPHLVRLLTVATSAEGLVLVLDYQGGGSLASLLRTRPVLAPGEVVTIAAPLASALAEVHRLGMVHGDVSPANILFAAHGRPMLSDLGVARLVSAQSGGSLTTAFADPAVLDGGPFTPASDVYALAAVCFTALTGALPGADASVRRPLSAVTPAVPWALAEVVESALTADVAGRPDAATFAARLLEAAPAAPVRLAGASVPVDSPATAAVRRLPAPPAAPTPVPSRAERALSRLSRLRVTPRRLAALAAAPVALAAAVWGGVAWARSTSAGAPAWTATSPLPTSTAAAARPGPLGRPGAPDPGPGPAAGAGASPAVEPSVSPRPGSAAMSGPASPAASPGAPPASRPRRATSAAVSMTQVLRRLDDLRDRALTEGSPALLDQVYAQGSAPLAEDRSSLVAMASLGERPTGLSLQVRRVTVVAKRPGVADLLVTDTLPSYDLVSATGRVDVAGRGEASWRIRLVETRSGWRISSVSRASAGTAAPTSGSRP